jgi:L-rhamnose isomerase / sugar isomerase
MGASFEITDELIASENRRHEAALAEDYEHLGKVLRRSGLDIEALTARASAFRVAVPSWGVGTGGTRFARFAGPGEPRDLFDKLDDCATIFQLVQSTPGVSLHIPWDRIDNLQSVKEHAHRRGLHIDAMNSNTFQDQPDQPLSYKFGSLAHPDRAVRQQAIEHNLECIRMGVALGSSALSVWIGDGGNFPGQFHARRALDRYIESMRDIHAALPAGWRLFLEHKLYEPAFYSTVINDWGTSYYAATQIGPHAQCLVDLGHHAPSVNVEMIVARLIQAGRLAGFHFNDSKYGDDDLDAGSIKPFELFLVFHELVDAELERVAGFDPAYMLDQSHNVTDPLESIMSSAIEVARGYVQAHLVDRAALSEAQERSDAIVALGLLKKAFTTDVSPILAVARARAGGAIDPLAAYRASGYRRRKSAERPARTNVAAGIV